MSRTTCPKCHDPSQDGLLCDRCTGQLEDNLEALPGLLDDLMTSYLRQSQTGTGNGGRGATRAVPFDNSASRVRDEITNDLSTTVRDLILITDPDPGTTPGAWCAWLLSAVPRIRMHPASGELAKGIERCKERAEYVVDTPRPRQYCGECPVCGAQLWATPGTTEVICERCKDAGRAWFSHNVIERRDQVRTDVLDKLATIEECALALAHIFGIYVPVNTLKTWRQRGRLVPHGELFRIGDALVLAEQSKRRPA